MLLNERTAEDKENNHSGSWKKLIQMKLGSREVGVLKPSIKDFEKWHFRQVSAALCIWSVWTLFIANFAL